MAQNKINKRIDVAVFAVLLLAASIITFQLFYHQTTGSEALYHSDMKAYILEMQGLDSGYSFPYPVFFKLSAFFDIFAAPEMAVAIATLVLNSGAMIIMKWALNHYALVQLENTFVKNKWMAGVLISLVSISLFFISMLLISIDNLDLTTNFTAVAATLNNIGPGLSKVGPTCNFDCYSIFSKFVLMFAMLAGRLELFPIILVIMPGTWKRNR